MEIKDIEKLAELSRIELLDNEAEKVLSDMENIVSFVDQIQKADVDITDPKAGVIRNIMREDGEPHESGKYTEDILREAPKTRDNYIEVKKIL